MKFILSKSQLEQLRKDDSILYHGIFNGLWGNKDGSITLHLDSPGYSGKTIGTAFRKNFPDYAATHGIREASAITDESAELDAVSNPDVSSTPIAKPIEKKWKSPSEDVDRANQALADLEAANKRWKQWLIAGLLPTIENDTLIKAQLAITNNWTVAGLDAAIEACRPSLAWRAVPQVEYVPRHRASCSGEPCKCPLSKEVRIPLTETPDPRKHSVLQLRDWDHRRMAAIDAERRKANTELARRYL